MDAHTRFLTFMQALRSGLHSLHDKYFYPRRQLRSAFFFKTVDLKSVKPPPLFSRCVPTARWRKSPVHQIPVERLCGDIALSVPQLVDDNNTTRKVVQYAVRPGTPPAPRAPPWVCCPSLEQAPGISCPLYCLGLQDNTATSSLSNDCSPSEWVPFHIHVGALKIKAGLASAAAEPRRLSSEEKW